MPIDTDVALKGSPLLTVEELVCKGQCVTEEGHIAEVSELRHDPRRRCSCDVEEFPDPASVQTEEDELAEEEQ